jgi:hypothetical protein
VGRLLTAAGALAALELDGNGAVGLGDFFRFTDAFGQ